MTTLKKLFVVFAFLFTASVFAAPTPIDINSADASTIAATMSGVGPAKAAAIVLYREERGPFKDISELTRVRGIGKATVAKNKERIQVVKKTKIE